MGTAQQTVRQHLVSQVLLKRFTMPGPKSSGWQLLPFDLDNPKRQHKLRTTRACGWVDNFISFDSTSAEALWCAVESRAPAALSALEAGSPFADPSHVEALRDLVMIHYVRSHHYRDVHIEAFRKARDGLRGVLVQRFPEQLRREALCETGLHLAGPGSLGDFAERLIARSMIVRDHESGKLFRTSIEDTFHKVQDMATAWQLEILVPEAGQFVIGDNPAVTVRREGAVTSYGMAFGDAHSLVLPIGPRHLLALGPHNTTGIIPKEVVDELNTVQIYAASRYVYLHPRSGLEAFVDMAVTGRTSS